MSDRPEKNDASVNVFDLIDQVCGDFRNQWKTGFRPAFEDYLTRVPENASETLFRNLLAVDIRYRQRGGDVPKAEDYLSTFPQFKRAIGDAFHYSTSRFSDDGGASTVSASTEMPDTIGAPAARCIGDYELIRELGRGGFGVVYEARHTKRGNRVALKTLPTGGDGQDINAERLHRFRREFRSLSEINHPNLVGMQSLEVDGSQWFFTMDLIEGVNFLAYVGRGPNLDEPRLRESLRQLANGIVALHNQRVLHRDLKPSNVMVDADGRVIILDFGLIAELEQRTDQTASAPSRQFAGTPRYAAPEQAFGQRSTATDWYAFGTMLYEALTGDAPFSGTHAEVLIRKQNEDAPSLSGRDDRPEDLARLADSLLQRDPERRPTAEDIASVLSVDFDSETKGSSDSSGGDSESSSHFDELNPWMIGREEQLNQLASARQELLQRHTPMAVWLTGLSGQGKSTLAESFLHPLRRREEWLVLSGRCYDRELVPFKVIDSQIDSLVRFLRGLPQAEVEKILPPDIEKLARLFPILRRVDPINVRCGGSEKPIGESQLRNLAFAALKDLLRQIGRSSPILMFVDDLQWGDRDSAEVLYELLCGPDPPPVLLLGAFRSDEMDESAFLLQWNRSGESRGRPIPIRNVPVDPLTKEECRALLKARWADAFETLEHEIDELYRNCKGNPYLLEQSLEGFDPETGVIRPRSPDEIVQTRLSRCPEGAVELLEAIAVAGKAVLPQEVAGVAGCSASGLATLNHMRSEKLVRWVDSEQEQLVDTYHDRIRETSLQSLPEARRKQLHRTYAEAIEASTPIVSQTPATERDSPIHPRAFELADHFEQAGDERAFKYLLQAGRAAVKSYAMETATEYLRRADALRPDTLDADTEYVLEMSLARAHFGCDAVEKSIEHCRKAVDAATDNVDEAEAWFLLAEGNWRMGDYRAGLELSRQAFAAVGERLPRTLMGNYLKSSLLLSRFHFTPFTFVFKAPASKRNAAAATAMFSKFGDMAIPFDLSLFAYSVARACALARKLDDPFAKMAAYSGYSHFLGTSGVNWLAERMMDVSKRYAKEVPSEARTLAKYHDGCRLYYRGQVEDALVLLREADETFARSGDWHRLLAVHVQRHCWSVKGNAFELFRHARQEFEIARQTGEACVTAWGLYGLSDAQSRAGEVAQAISNAEEAIGILEEHGALTALPIAYLEKGRAELQGSRYGCARKSLRRAIALVIQLRVFEMTVGAFPLYVEAVLGNDWTPSSAHGVSSKDRRYASWAARAARLFGVTFSNHLPHALRVTGRFHTSRKKYSKAIRAFDKAISAAPNIGAEYEQARALIDKSLLEYRDSDSDRQRGLRMIEELGCVLPDAELTYLGLDRDRHHANAAAARKRMEAKLEESVGAGAAPE